MDLTLPELKDFFIEMGQEKFRAEQVIRWISKGVKDVGEMTDMPKSLKAILNETSYIGKLKILKKLVSGIDGTVKYLFELGDGNAIESVLMEYKHGLTACVSSQVGCRMGCRFCASAAAGFVRNLTPGEVLDQVISIQTDTGRRVGNVVIMGIGEPLDNYGNILKFLKIINLPVGLNIGYRHITISTCGLVPEIIALSEEKMPVNLSISLHAPRDEIRAQIMPIGRKYSIDKIIEACKIYTEATRRRITFEYATIEGLNDSDRDAAELARRIKGLLCHVNLIPVNAVDALEKRSAAGETRFMFKQSSRQRMERFKSILEGAGIETTIRRELGADINAACGQLRRSVVS